MSSQLPVPPLDDDEVLAEDQYVEIPDWHRELIRESMARYREVGMEGSTWEEFEKELDQLIEDELKNQTRAK